MRTLADYLDELAAERRVQLARVDEGLRATYQGLIDHPQVPEDMRQRCRARVADAMEESQGDDTPAIVDGCGNVTATVGEVRAELARIADRHAPSE